VTAKLPSVLKVAIFYDAKMLPFEQNNFGVPGARIWDNFEIERKYVTPGQDFENATIAVEANGLRQLNYGFKRMYKLRPLDEYDDEIDTSCTILEFEAM
jgi:hypothetical protein